MARLPSSVAPRGERIVGARLSARRPEGPPSARNATTTSTSSGTSPATRRRARSSASSSPPNHPSTTTSSARERRTILLKLYRKYISPDVAADLICSTRRVQPAEPLELPRRRDAPDAPFEQPAGRALPGRRRHRSCARKGTSRAERRPGAHRVRQVTANRCGRRTPASAPTSTPWPARVTPSRSRTRWGSR